VPYPSKKSAPSVFIRVHPWFKINSVEKLCNKIARGDLVHFFFTLGAADIVLNQNFVRLRTRQPLVPHFDGKP